MVKMKSIIPRIIATILNWTKLIQSFGAILSIILAGIVVGVLMESLVDLLISKKRESKIQGINFGIAFAGVIPDLFFVSQYMTIGGWLVIGGLFGTGAIIGYVVAEIWDRFI